MTPTEIFKLFFKYGLDPYERLAIMMEVKKRIYGYRGHHLFFLIHSKENVTNDIIEKSFVERLMYSTMNVRNTCGAYEAWTWCTSLSSFMKYLLYYIPSIIGNSKNKNKYLEKINIEIPKNIGYKHYWERRLINKWHIFLKEHVKNYDKYVDTYCSMNAKFHLKHDLCI